jgi:hypothetical protein
MAELLVHPARFFGRMATTGGLHEPLTFFAVTLTTAILLAFPAALSHLGVAAPDPERSAELYALYVTPARVAGLLLVLLPLAVVVGCAKAVLLGSLFHAGGKVFGSRNWEGSVSVWLYAASAALVPGLISVGVVFVVSLAGYLLGLAWPGARETAGAFAGWTLLILGPAGLLAGLIVLVMHAIIGCTRAFELEAMLGAACGVSGLVVVGAALALSFWSFGGLGLAGGLIVAGACVLIAALTALLGLLARRRAERSA